MASITLQVGAEYPAGTTVSVYSTTNSVPTTPVGAPVTTGTVGADGQVTFTGLTENRNYLAYSAAGHPQYVQFYVPVTAASSAGVSGVILPWATGTAYVAGQPVTNGGNTYLAVDAHTSGATFAGDLAAHWTLLPGGGGGVVLPWATATVYKTGQLVTNSAKTWTAVDDHTSGATFTGDAAHWALLPGGGYAGFPGYDIVILAGQSNMVGRVNDANVNTTDPTDYRISAFNMTGSTAGQIVLAKDPLGHQDPNFSNSGVGPGIEFARWYLGLATTARRVLLVPVAYAGTRIGGSGTPRWDSTLAGSLYDGMIGQVRAAVAAAGANSRVVAVLWQQGESDGDAAMSQASYQAALLTLIDRLRNDLADVTLPFVMLGILPEGISLFAGWPAIAAAHAAIPALRGGTAYVAGTPGYDTGVDHEHYNSAGARLNGRNAVGGYALAQANAATATVRSSVPGRVLDLIASPGTTTAALTWTAPDPGSSPITDYVVQYRTSAGPGTWTTFTHSASPATTMTVTGLTAATNYDFRIAAVNANGAGDYGTAVTIVARDTFNRSDGNLGTASDGLHTWAILPAGAGPLSSLAQISSNRLSLLTSSGQPFGIDAGVSNCTVQATLVSGSRDTGFVFRASDANHYWMFFLNSNGAGGAGGGKYALLKANAGYTWVVDTGIVPSDGDLLSVVLVGASITLKRNGLTIASTSDAFNQTATQYGFWASGATLWDDFAVLA